MVAKINMTGRVIGRVLVLGPATSRSGHAAWRCRCDCGKEYTAHGSNLRRSTTMSCGCHAHEVLGKRRFIDLTGRKFGRLEAICRAPGNARRVTWHCQCACGKSSKVTACDLTSGHTKSCGCLAAEMLGSGNRIHGRSCTTEHTIWCQMNQRCTNRNLVSFKNYGGRGITVCRRWRASFAAFLADMGPRPPGLSLDRINNDLGYSKSNCRWATSTEQGRNKRNNRWIEFNGEIRTLGDWCNIRKLNPSTVCRRINTLGWSAEDALTVRPGSARNK